jgi:hypothetical protein
MLEAATLAFDDVVLFACGDPRSVMDAIPEVIFRGGVTHKGLQ